MATSRSAVEFLARAGLEAAQAAPRPRLPPGSLLVHRVPLEAPLPGDETLCRYEGEPTPDRAASRPWPNQ